MHVRTPDQHGGELGSPGAGVLARASTKAGAAVVPEPGDLPALPVELSQQVSRHVERPQANALGPLAGAGMTAVTAVVVAHLGVAAVSQIAHAAATSQIADLAITQDASWQDLGAAVFIASEFGQVSKMHVHLRLETKSVHGGGTPQLRLVDDDGTTVVELHPSPWFTIADGASFICDAFQAIDTPPVSDTVPHLLRLEGRRNGATSPSIRRAHITLVELQ